MTEIILGLVLTFVPIGATGVVAADEPAGVAQAASVGPPQDDAVSQDEAAPASEPAGAGEADQQEAEAAEAPEGAPAGAASQPATTAPAPQAEAEIKPRLELFIPSVAELIGEARRSHSAPLVRAAVGLLGSGHGAAEDEIDWREVVRLIGKLGDWPDTSIVGAIYAPDLEGRPRFGVRLDYSVGDLHARLSELLADEAAAELFEGLTIRPREQGGYVVALREVELAHLLPGGDGQCHVLSHADVDVPERVWGWRAPGGEAADEPTKKQRLLYCRYNLVGTEKDTGSIFGDIPWVRSIDYWCQVDDTGQWEEQFAAWWNGLVSLAAQQAISMVKGAYYVPADAYAFAVLGIPFASMLDMMLDLPPGTLDAGGKDETCVCVLPGTGFLPVPDIVFQMPVRKPDGLIEDLAEAAEKVNRKLEEEDQQPVWRDAEVTGRRVFWRQPETGGGMYAPFAFRSLLFTEKVTDPRGKERDLLILIMTSTDPQETARRWLTRPKVSGHRAVPTAEELHWQGFVRWKAVYKLAAPWLNLAGSISADARLLPPAEEMAEHLADSQIDVQRKMHYLLARHRGPLPLGGAYVPAICALAGAARQFASTDLAREREAVRNLRVLHHHSKLFKKDYDRWPAELWELDGYVDFASHPRLLELRKSSRGAWKSWFEETFTLAESQEQEQEGAEQEEEDEEGRPDTSLYVIDWGRQSWTLGLKQGALDHLERLYIDQDGKIHRVEKQKPEEPAGAAEESETSAFENKEREPATE